MSGSGDDDEGEPVRRRGAVLPPPDESTDSIHLPRMEPPPASLEAMVQSRNRSRTPQPEAGGSWWLWVLLLVAAALVTGYVMR